MTAWCTTLGTHCTRVLLKPRTVQLSSCNVLGYKCSVTYDECNSAIATVDRNIESTVALPKHAKGGDGTTLRLSRRVVKASCTIACATSLPADKFKG